MILRSAGSLVQRSTGTAGPEGAIMSGKILIVDDLVTNRIILKVKLSAASHSVVQAGTGTQALQVARTERPGLILLDMMLPDLPGIEVLRQLRDDPALRHTPIIVISASTRREDRLRALEAGADAFLTKPLNETVLLARIRNLLRAAQTDSGLRLQAETCQDFGLAEAAAAFDAAPRITLIAPDPGTAHRWKGALSRHLPGTYSHRSPAAALADCAGLAPPDLLVIAADPQRPADTMRLIADLRARESGQTAGLCLALDNVDQDTAALALDLGANEIVALPLDGQETALRLRVLLARQRRAEALRNAVLQGLELAATDSLTGLYNRRYALACLDRIAASALETGSRFAVMILDLDHFKSVNDRFGHAAGDAVLMAVSARLSAALRPSDLIARIGGEEFLVALSDVTLPVAREVAGRLRMAVAASPIPLPDGLGAVTVTLSVGLTMGPDAAPQPGPEPAPGSGPGSGCSHTPTPPAAPAPGYSGHQPPRDAPRTGPDRLSEGRPRAAAAAAAAVTATVRGEICATGALSAARAGVVPGAVRALLAVPSTGPAPAREAVRVWQTGGAAGSGPPEPENRTGHGVLTGQAVATGASGPDPRRRCATGPDRPGTPHRPPFPDPGPSSETASGPTTGATAAGLPSAPDGALPVRSAAQTALSRADLALLSAKGDGRNQVTVLTAA
jgi:two-component system, cell cycle response regulator